MKRVIGVIGVLLLISLGLWLLSNKEQPYYNSRGAQSGDASFSTLEDKVEKLEFPDNTYRVKVDFGYGFRGTNFLGKFPASIQNGTATLVKTVSYVQLITDSADLTLTLDMGGREGKVYSTGWNIATPLSQDCSKLEGKYDLKWTSSTSIRIVLQQTCKENVVVTYWDIYGLPVTKG